jgi:hypothetical protein
LLHRHFSPQTAAQHHSSSQIELIGNQDFIQVKVAVQGNWNQDKTDGSSGALVMNASHLDSSAQEL